MSGEVELTERYFRRPFSEIVEVMTMMTKNVRRAPSKNYPHPRFFPAQTIRVHGLDLERKRLPLEHAVEHECGVHCCQHARRLGMAVSKAELWPRGAFVLFGSSELRQQEKATVAA